MCASLGPPASLDGAWWLGSGGGEGAALCHLSCPALGAEMRQLSVCTGYKGGHPVTAAC